MGDVMFDALLRHLNGIANGEEHPEFTQTEINSAVVSLLSRVVLADGLVVPEEVSRLEKLVTETIGKDVIDWKGMLESMESGETLNEPIFATTQVLLEGVDLERRERVVEMMVDIAVSDGVIKPEEREFIEQVAELLKVTEITF